LRENEEKGTNIEEGRTRARRSKGKESEAEGRRNSRNQGSI